MAGNTRFEWVQIHVLRGNEAGVIQGWIDREQLFHLKVSFTEGSGWFDTTLYDEPSVEAESCSVVFRLSNVIMIQSQGKPPSSGGGKP